MNRKSLLVMVVLALLNIVSGVYAKGALKNGDAYSVYMGISKETVSRIAPAFEELYEDYYLVDYYDHGGDDFLALAVEFDEGETVESVDILITTGMINELKEYDFWESAGQGLWDLGAELFDLFLDTYAAPDDPESVEGKVDRILRNAADRGVKKADAIVSKSVILANAAEIGLNYLGIDPDLIIDEAKTSSYIILYTASGDVIVTEELDTDLYIASVFRM